MTNELAAYKQSLRKNVKSRLRDLQYSPKEVARDLLRNLMTLSSFNAAQTIGLFIDFQNEIPISQLLPELFEARGEEKRLIVAAPYCFQNAMFFYKLARTRRDENDVLHIPHLARSRYGVQEPDLCARANPHDFVPPKRFDLLVVPGLAFDRTGARLGRGAGYYDRYLPLLRADARRVAVAFDEQIVDAVPTTPEDQPVDFIVTPSQVIATNARLASDLSS